MTNENKKSAMIWLPKNVSSHIDVNGNLDRTMSKTNSWLMYAGIGIAIPAIISGLRYVDPPS
jgi:hypothetical protein